MQLAEYRPVTRINTLIAKCPAGAPMTTAWLANQAVSPQLLQRYKASGWLELLGRGAWIRADTQPTLAGAIYALQQMEALKIYPAARTALELQGRAHYIATGIAPVLQLSVERNIRIPRWFKEQGFAKHIQLIKSDALFNPVFASITECRSEGATIKVSSPERAILEYCQLLPRLGDFEEVWQLMAGLTSLQPTLVQSTLQACLSVKAKRLFLVLAEAVGHTWFKELNLDTLELGVGKRSLRIPGTLHPRFKITVPNTWKVT
jgi:hypothetical protein